MIVLGIDPGIGGGWAVVQDDGKLLDCGRMPTMKNGKKNVANGVVLANLVIWPIDVSVVEQVGTMPGQGISSAFSFGWSTGAAVMAGMIKSNRIDGVIRVTPQVWKRHFQLEKDKRASLNLADKLWPNWDMWGVLANDGIAEAALMAKWYLDNN